MVPAMRSYHLQRQPLVAGVSETTAVAHSVGPGVLFIACISLSPEDAATELGQDPGVGRLCFELSGNGVSRLLHCDQKEEKRRMKEEEEGLSGWQLTCSATWKHPETHSSNDCIHS